MAFKPAPFKSALSFPNRSMDQLVVQIKQQKQILQTLRAVLPETLAQQLHHCLINGNKLLIYTSSAAWASQLRFYDKALLAAIAPLTNQSVIIVQTKLVIDQIGPNQADREPAMVPALEKLEAIRDFCRAGPDNELTAALLKLTKTLEHLGAIQHPDEGH
jgi:hypothetical protein